jgi:hypothetical protein
VTSDLARDLVTTTAIVTVYALVGVVAVGAGIRLSGRGRAPTLLLAWAMLQHAVNELAGGPIPGSLGSTNAAFTWIGVVTGYFIAVPWALLLERMLGRGWHSTIRLTAAVFVTFAVGCTVFDAIIGGPGRAAGVNRTVVAVGAAVAFGHLWAMRGGDASRLKLMRAGILLFMALVVHDALVRAGALPWPVESGAWAVLICVAAIAYTVVGETMRRRRELQDVEHELATARRIQSSLVPRQAPVLDGAEVVFRYVPATAVAGDIFDFMPIGPRQLGVLVADVSGHGVPAALIASMVKVAGAAQKPHADDPGRVLAGIHLAIANELPPAHFVTAVYAYVDLDRSVLRCASAGHPPPIVWHASGAPVADVPTGPLIISFAPAAYPVTEVALAPGDRVVMYTDGVTEASGPDEELFGVERLRAIVAASGSGADRMASSIVDAAAAFRQNGVASFEDDCTLVALEVSAR